MSDLPSTRAAAAPRRLRRSLRWATVAAAAFVATGFAATAGLASPPAATAKPQSMVVPVDRQVYITAATTTNPSDGSTVDAYDNDPSSIHVAINGGSPFAWSFVHLALDYLPSNARVSQVTMTLHLTAQSDASNTGVYPIYNVNTGQAIVQACALKTEVPADWDGKNPPAYDCEHGSAVGRPSADGQTWTFPLEGLVGYWHEHGNTGAALVPVGSGDPSQTWGVAFYKSRSTSTVAYELASAGATTGARTGAGSRAGSAVSVPAAGASAGAPPPGPPPVTTGPLPGGATATGAPGPAAAPSVAAPSTPQAQAAAGVDTRGSGGATHWWPAVLVGCLLVAAGALGVAHREAVSRWAARIGPPAVGAFRAHPRAYGVATVAVVWGLVFTGYSVVVPTGSAQTPLASSATAPGAAGSQQPGAVASGPSAGPAPASIGASAGTSARAAASGAGGISAAPVARSVNPAAQEFSGKGTYRTINGVRVFFPADGGPPVADLYHGADDTVGITPDTIRLCAHAALTYGSAFHISASDLDVYWRWLNDHGGVFGRKVVTNYTNDNYDPGTAVQAAQACKDWGTFILLGGIGFDQIPAVRQWAEQNHMLYLHHVATIENTAGLRYSFSALPSVEDLGREMGRLAVWQLRGKKIGIIYRNSSNWSPGVGTFEQAVESAGMQVVGSYPVTINQGNYTQEIAQLQAKGAQVVLAWENALATVEIIKQAQGQDYHPTWLIFPFNLITNTLGSSSLDQPIWGVSAGWDAYDPGYYGGGFASYAADIKEFEAEYRHYDPNADLSGDGGDLLFGAWEAWRFMADLLKTCGPDCTRNKLAGIMLAGYHKTVSPNCDVNFGRTSDHHHGGYLFDAMQVVKDPNGRANFVPVERCVPDIGPRA